MRFTALIIVAGLGLWVVAGMPVPVTVVRPLTPDPDLPTFAQASADLSLVQEAVEMGRVEQNPVRRRLREALLDASERLRLDPCSAELRASFAAAAVPFLEAQLGNRQFPPEPIEIEGRTLSASNHFDEPVYNAISDALSEGRLRNDDLPEGLSPFHDDFVGLFAGVSDSTCTS